MATNKADTPSTASAPARTPDPAARWRHLAGPTLDRAPAPYGVMALLLGAVVLAEQIMEEALLGPVEKFFASNNLRHA